MSEIKIQLRRGMQPSIATGLERAMQRAMQIACALSVRHDDEQAAMLLEELNVTLDEARRLFAFWELGL